MLQKDRARHQFRTTICPPDQNNLNPHDVLSVKPSVSNEELKSHYRRLAAENHPDQLIARGLPKEFVFFATKKITAINEAYDQIAKEQKF